MKLLSILLLLSLLTGCISMQPNLESGDNPSPDKGYLSGHFINSYRESFHRMALAVVSDETEKEFYIELERPNNSPGLTLVEVDPGTYKLDSVIKFTGSGDAITERYSLDDLDIFKVFEVHVGEIVYLGNFDGKNTHRIESLLLLPAYQYVRTGGNGSYTYSFTEIDEIKGIIQNTYPSFSNLHLRTIVDVKKIKESEQGSGGGITTRSARSNPSL